MALTAIVKYYKMILIVDDDKAIRMSLRLLMERNGYQTVLASTPDEAINAVRTLLPQLVIMDMNYTNKTTGEEGLELLAKIRVLAPDVPVIMITAWGSIPLAVEGMRLGAFDFITKPWDNHLLLQRVETAHALNANSRDTSCKITDSNDFDACGIIGNSPQIRNILESVKRIAPTNASVLITGENGTGKELIAQAIHANSKRSKAPFVKVNLGGISQSLFESEMFGHAKGAYTGAVAERKGRFEVADTGTIFLDEIGDLDLACQVKMLRVLQEHTFERLGESRPRKIDIRVISATNADLQSMVKDKTFREDLFYRINLITIHLPALRERKSDIPLLVKHFALKINVDTVFDDGALDLLSSLSYSGNIRELKNLVERIILLTPKTLIESSDIRPLLSPTELVAEADGNLITLERQAIIDALAQTSNIAQAAALLGITRQALYRRMAKYDIQA